MKKHKIDFQNKGDTMSRQLTKLISIYFALLILAAVSGCSDDDCPTCPEDETVKPYRGYLYYTEGNPELHQLYKIDMETDSIVDSLFFSPGNALAFDLTEDGRLLAILDNRDPLNFSDSKTWLVDPATMTITGELPFAMLPFFDQDRGLIVGMHNNSTSYLISVLDFTTHESIYEDSTFGFAGEVIDRKGGFMYGSASETSFADHRLGSNFYRYDYVNRRLELVPIIYPNGDTIQVFKFCLNEAGTRVYFKGITVVNPPLGLAVVGSYDIESQTLLWTFETMGSLGGVGVSPDGQEVYMTDPGHPGFDFDTGTIFILDAITGAYLHGISMYGYQPEPLVALQGSDVLFSPTGEKAYVVTGGVGGRWPGSMVVVDTKKREITKIISPDLQRHPYMMRIGPKP